MNLTRASSTAPRVPSVPFQEPPLTGGIFGALVYQRYCQALGERMQAYRRQRTAALGPHLQLLFENELTVAHRTLEALNSTGFDAGGSLNQALLRFAHLLPDSRSLCATLVSIQSAAADSPGVVPLEWPPDALCIEWDRGVSVTARCISDDTPATSQVRPVAAQVLRFDLSPPAQTALRELAPARLSCAHDGHRWRQALPQTLLARLRCDSSGLASPLGLAAAVKAMWAIEPEP